MHLRRLARLAALTHGPILVAGGAACVQSQPTTNVVSAPTADPGTPAAADPAPTPEPSASAMAPEAASPADNDNSVREAGIRRFPILNAPRFWQDGGRIGGPRPPGINAPPGKPPGDPSSP